MFVLFVCFGVIITLENVSQVWKRHQYRWRAPDLAYSRHSWPLSSEGSLVCHTFCDTGHCFIMVISAECDTHFCCRAFSSGHVTTCFNGIGLRFTHPILRMQAECSNRLCHRRGPILGTIRKWVLNERATFVFNDNIVITSELIDC